VNSTGPDYVKRNPGGILGLGPDGAQTIAEQTGQPLPGLLTQLKPKDLSMRIRMEYFLEVNVSHQNWGDCLP
jgi:hypothetical protein